MKKQTLYYIKEQSNFLTISKIAQRIKADLQSDEDPALGGLLDHIAEATSISRGALSTVEHVSDKRVYALAMDIQLGIWVDKLGYQFKEVFDRIHADHGRSADCIQVAISEAVNCLRAQADLRKSWNNRLSDNNAKPPPQQPSRRRQPHRPEWAPTGPSARGAN